MTTYHPTLKLTMRPADGVVSPSVTVSGAPAPVGGLLSLVKPGREASRELIEALDVDGKPPLTLSELELALIAFASDASVSLLSLESSVFADVMLVFVPRLRMACLILLGGFAAPPANTLCTSSSVFGC